MAPDLYLKKVTPDDEDWVSVDGRCGPMSGRYQYSYERLSTPWETDAGAEVGQT